MINKIKVYLREFKHNRRIKIKNRYISTTFPNGRKLTFCNFWDKNLSAEQLTSSLFLTGVNSIDRDVTIYFPSPNNSSIPKEIVDQGVNHPKINLSKNSPVKIFFTGECLTHFSYQKYQELKYSKNIDLFIDFFVPDSLSCPINNQQSTINNQQSTISLGILCIVCILWIGIY